MNQSVLIIPYLLEPHASGQISISMHRIEGDYPAHAHDYYEMELVTGGNGWQWINNVRTPIKKGSLFLLTPADIHRIESDGPIESVSIHYLPEIAATAGLEDVEEAFFMQLSDADYDLFFTLAQRLTVSDAASRPHFSRELLCSATLMLVHLLRHGQTRVAPVHSHHMLRALQYIHTHYSNTELRLAHAAQLCGLSVCHFSATFHEIVGCCFSEYLMRYRLHRAGSLLQNGSATVSEIAYAVGFSSLPHFFRAFRRAYGCTPLEYRRRADSNAQKDCQDATNVV